MQIGDRKILNQLKGTIKCCLVFSGESHHNIHTDSHVRNCPPDFFQAVSEKSRMVGPSHPLQNIVTAALQRNMEMMT